MESRSEVQTTVSYRVDCAACGLSFDAVAAETCQCLGGANTPVCPACGQCLCGLPREIVRSFWRGAPEVLWQRRLVGLGQRGEGACLKDNAPLKRPLVLVADDEPMTRCMAKRLIEKMGYGVVTAGDGKEALRLAIELRPDLILSDALMPGLDGRELARRLKATPGLSSIKVLLMTSIYTKEKYKNEAMATFHCDGYLKKPISAEGLRELCVRSLGS